MKLERALAISRVQHRLDTGEKYDSAARIPLGSKESLVTFNGLSFYIDMSEDPTPYSFLLHEIDTSNYVKRV